MTKSQSELGLLRSSFDFEAWRFIYTVSREKGHLRVRKHELIGDTPTSLRKRPHRR